MNWDKEQGKDDGDRLNTGTLLAAETLRNASASALLARGEPRGEERISVFWRVFGGTLLSIAALIVVTLYQQFTSTLTELRGSLNHLNESQANLVKKDEFNSRITSLWNTAKDLQVANAAAGATKDRVTALEQQLRTCNDERKDLTKQLLDVRERLAALEGRRGTTAPAKSK